MSKVTKTTTIAFSLTILAGCVLVSSVSAVAPRGVGEEFPTYKTGDDIRVCDMSRVELAAESPASTSQSFDACIVHGKDVDFAYLYGSQASKNGMPLVRLRDTQSRFSQLQGLRNVPQILEATNTVVYSSGAGLTVVNDFTKAISPSEVVGGEVRTYEVNLNAYDKKILTENGTVGSFRISSDSAYVVAYVDDTGVLKYNLKTGANTALAMIDGHSKTAQNKPRVGAVSSDGRFIFMGPEGEIIDTLRCGDEFEGKLADAVPQHPCYRHYIGNITEKVAGLGAQTDGGLFSADSQELSFAVRKQEGSKITMHRVAIAVPGVKQITYLALGDSFASGEGNLNTSGPGYRWGTDVSGSKTTPTEKCHLSELSYPFLLAGKMAYGQYAIDDSMNWSSVACSGAVIDDVSARASTSYEGQKQDDVSRLKSFDVSDLKYAALNEMVPGRQKQIEFVRKYQPKAITISIGGNDAQFGSTIAACVQPVGKGSEWTSTCSYAKDDGKKANIAYTIFALRNKLMDVYQELLDAGPPDMKLYVVGYPIIVDKNPSNATCGMSVRLNNSEREMVIESTKLLNMMARSAADEAGAIFISTENSFGESVLCGSADKKAVNGIVLSSTSASFHPNTYGHTLMAERIQDALGNASLEVYTCRDSYYVTCPGGEAAQISMPDYFKRAINNHSRALNDQNIVSGFLRNVANVPITVGSYIYGANSPVSIILYSDPQEIGTFQTGEDGSLNVNISLPPDTPSGYHTLEIHGTGVDGQPLILWKIVEVESPNNPNEEYAPKDTGAEGQIVTKTAEDSGGILKSQPVGTSTGITHMQKVAYEKTTKSQENTALIDSLSTRKSSEHEARRPSLLLLFMPLGVLTGILATWLIIRKYKGTRT